MHKILQVASYQDCPQDNIKNQRIEDYQHIKKMLKVSDVKWSTKVKKKESQLCNGTILLTYE